MKPPIVLLFILLASCSREAGETPKIPVHVIAKVGSEQITVQDLESAMRKRHALQTPEGRQTVLEDLIFLRAMVQEARRRGYDKDPGIMEEYDRLLVDKLRDSQPKEAAEAVSEEECRMSYELWKSQFTIPGRLRGSMILIESPSHFSEAKRAERAATAAGVLRMVREPGSDFGALAARHSFDQATKHRGGDLGYFQENTLDPALDPVLLETLKTLKEPGETSGVVCGPRGFYIVKLTESVKPRTRSFDETKEEIRLRIGNRKKSAAKDSFREKILSQFEIRKFSDHIPR